jgi:hypothetical protein
VAEEWRSGGAGAEWRRWRGGGGTGVRGGEGEVSATLWCVTGA